MIAKLLKENLENFNGDASLYELTPPMQTEDGETSLVVVSATVAMFSGPETYIFPADKNGEVTDWGELDGSTRGTMSHESALGNAGYSISE